MSEQSKLREALELRAQYHHLEEFQRPLFIVKWLDEQVSKYEKAALVAQPVEPPAGTKREYYHETIEKVLAMRKIDLKRAKDEPEHEEYCLGRAHRCDDILFWLGYIEANIPAGQPPTPDVIPHCPKCGNVCAICWDDKFPAEAEPAPPDADTVGNFPCKCDRPYEGTHVVNSPNRCERCRGLVVKDADLQAARENSSHLLTERDIETAFGCSWDGDHYDCSLMRKTLNLRVAAFRRKAHEEALEPFKKLLHGLNPYEVQDGDLCIWCRREMPRNILRWEDGHREENHQADCEFIAAIRALAAGEGKEEK